MSILFRASLLLAVFFGINKAVALVRQIIIGRQFGLGAEIDAFNVANNFPDLLVALISGGALALAFIPVLSEYIKKYGGEKTCRLFSDVANLVFATTAVFSLIAAVAAPTLVSAEFGIAPGFSPSQQMLVVNLMRLSLLSTLIFALSGLVTSYLQAHKQFLLPALSPILYNLGLIFGAVILAPTYGIYGLGIGVVIGSLLHFFIQIPGLFIYKFRYYPAFDLKDPGLLKVLNLMLPRIATVLLIQISFLTRDNLASRLPEGSVSALTYGYFIMQVPETLIGTAIATALLPTLSEFATEKKYQDFAIVLNKTVKILAASTIFITVVLSLCLTPLVELIFGLNGAQRDLLVWTSRAYLFGLLFQCLLEVVARAFYARQNAVTPLLATVARTIIFLILAVTTFRTFGAFGIALADSIAIAAEVLILTYYLLKFLPNILSSFFTTSLRIGSGLVLSVFAIYGVFTFTPFPDLAKAILSMLLATIIYLPFVRKEIKMLLRL
jgi:putative peptidoglycan lipid II flippase